MLGQSFNFEAQLETAIVYILRNRMEMGVPRRKVVKVTCVKATIFQQHQVSWKNSFGHQQSDSRNARTGRRRLVKAYLSGELDLVAWG